jgi:hypothetical protein
MSRGFVKEDDQEEILLCHQGRLTGKCSKLCYSSWYRDELLNEKQELINGRESEKNYDEK